MKKTIPNPNYENAKYALGWVTTGKIGVTPPDIRFSIPPPAGLSKDELAAWIEKNQIPPTIEVNE